MSRTLGDPGEVSVPSEGSGSLETRLCPVPTRPLRSVGDVQNSHGSGVSTLRQDLWRARFWMPGPRSADRGGKGPTEKTIPFVCLLSASTSACDFCV